MQSDKPRCGAKTRTGKPCKAFPMSNGRCRMHGGAANNKGARNGNFKHGRYSKSIPIRLAAKYEAAEADPERTALASELSLIDTRLGEVLEMLETGEDRTGWSVLGMAISDFEQALVDNEDPDLVGQIVDGRLKAIRAAWESGANQWQLWDKVAELVALRAKVADSENKRLVQAGLMVGPDEIATYVGLVMSCFRRNTVKHVPLSYRKVFLDGVTDDLDELLSTIHSGPGGGNGDGNTP